jgi:hypothetical protein
MFAMIFKCFSGVFASVSSVFFYMLQLSYLIVSKVNRVLPMGFAWEAVGGADDIQGGMGDVRGGAGDVRDGSSCWCTRSRALHTRH